VARVYVSSTYSDLREHRESVYRILRQLGHDAVAMETFVASDQRPLDQCLAAVAASDLYIGILAFRYGYIPESDNPDGLSITELEYRHASALGLPRLVFLLGEDTPWPRQFMDTGNSGRLIETFRDEVQRNLLVGHFSGPDDLARQVAVAVSHELTGAGSVTDPNGGGLTLHLISAPEDTRLVSELMSYLSTLERSGLMSGMSSYQASGSGSARIPGHPDAMLSECDVVVPVLSIDLLRSGYLESDEFLQLVRRHEAKRLQLVPVLLRPVPWSSVPPHLQRIPPLPSADRSVTEAHNRDAAVAEVVDGIRLACQEIVTRRQRTPDSAPPQRAIRTRHRLVEVFKGSGVPSVTFIEPPDFLGLILDLEQPGRGLVIEGPSGVGKTTALHTALEQLDTGTRANFEMLSARKDADVARIATLATWHEGGVVIDDFHRLDPALRADLADYIKVLADTEPEDRKLVIVGIPGTRKRLVEVAFDLATRIGFLSLGTVHDDKVLKMIEKGEAALNVELHGKAEIVRLAAGSLNVAQILCRHVIALDGIQETQTTLTPVDSNLPQALQKAMETMTLKFGGLVKSFAALDGPSERLCIELLMELAAAEDGTLSLWELSERRPELLVGIRQFVKNQPMEPLCEHHPGYDQHLLYDPAAAALVIDDPQFTFYLRQLNPAQLALSVGKRPQAKRLRIFVSYSRHDAAWLQRLRVHLKPLERDGLIDLWDDTRIAAGSLWRVEVDAALDSARVAVLLISGDFLASDFIADNELPPLLEAADRDGCTIMPLLVQPSLFEQTQLSRFQAVNRDSSTLGELPTADQEKIMVRLAKEIAALVKGQS
jgi:Domain of unknown function (DUF4062)/TIR domain